MLPQAFIDRLTAQFGASAKEVILSAYKTKRLPSFRTNVLLSSDDKVMAALREMSVQFERAKTIPHAFLVRNKTSSELLESDLAKQGQIYLQGLTSMLPPLLLDPRPGETVLDLCAAPGSKTSQLAALLFENAHHAMPPLLPEEGLPASAKATSRSSEAFGEGGGVVRTIGRIVACEPDEIRFQKLTNTLRVQGAHTVETKNFDATLLHHEMPEAFDKILADVPCSAEGRIDLSNKRSYSFWSEKNIIAHAKLQRRLLRSAICCLKPGGTLVYSTCTLAPEENELMIDWPLAEYPFMKAETVTIPFSPTKKHKNGSVTLLPSKDAEGFFVAKLRKSTPID